MISKAQNEFLAEMLAEVGERTIEVLERKGDQFRTVVLYGYDTVKDRIETYFANDFHFNENVGMEISETFPETTGEDHDYGNLIDSRHFEKVKEIVENCFDMSSEFFDYQVSAGGAEQNANERLLKAFAAANELDFVVEGNVIRSTKFAISVAAIQKGFVAFAGSENESSSFMPSRCPEDAFLRAMIERNDGDIASGDAIDEKRFGEHLFGIYGFVVYCDRSGMLKVMTAGEDFADLEKCKALGACDLDAVSYEVRYILENMYFGKEINERRFADFQKLIAAL